uniref:NADH-ubiquinone oxidoreductase chain 4L n=1 Tax=Rhyacophila quadrifida TaxID=2904903 RepID=A0A9E8LPC4_9NEOP|nr:NADH dehydrogenase subunit 4L [Rhyacophila quadrifida]UZZ44373.1 NADH dehydrogenase subunit 4L [Rhyacophila quadrifida]
MKMMSFSFLSLFMYFMGGVVFSFNRKHLLVVLLMLEFMVLSLIMVLMMMLFYLENEVYFIMLILVFSVCEGALGLSILVQMVRMYGGDYFQVFNLLKC